MDNKRVISVAVIGSWPTRENNPAIPMTPSEIADSAIESWKAGAAVVHIHVRDDNGGPSIEFAKYKEVVDRIRSFPGCDVCINVTSSGTLDGGDEERMYPIEQLLPEMASFDAGTMNWLNSTIFENSPRFLEKLGPFLQRINVKPEIEIFDGGMIGNAIYYINKGVLKSPCHFQLVLGAAGGMDATVENLVYLRNHLPADCTWGATGIGKGHIPIMMATIAMGGHIRMGFEDCVYYKKGELAKSNAQYVERAVRLLHEAGLEPATPDEARQILGLTRKVF